MAGTAPESCFVNVTEGCPDGTVYPGDQTDGRCPVMMTSTSAGIACRSWCRSNTEDCLAGARAYCQGENAPRGACRCLTPTLSTGWLASGRITSYSDAVVLTAGFTMEPRCAWGACYAGLASTGADIRAINQDGTVFVAADIISRCPGESEASVYCALTNSTLSFEQVRAENISYVQQSCATQTYVDENGKASADAPPSKHVTRLRTGLVAGCVVAVLVAVIVAGVIAHKKQTRSWKHRIIVSSATQ